MNDHKNVKLLFLDVDGTLTDGKIYIGSGGELMKAFSAKDGYGIHNILIPAGIRPVIITGRKSEILEYRCAELGITDLYQNVADKLPLMIQISQKYGIPLSETAYAGDDLNDLPCMMKVLENNGIVGCPADAVETVKAISSFVSEKNGGNGAVRDFIDFICG